jgi:hypothetical protein
MGHCGSPETPLDSETSACAVPKLTDRERFNNTFELAVLAKATLKP